jgi:hypothetical protein
MSMLHPELFVCIASIVGAVGCSGGADSDPSVNASIAVIANVTLLLPLIAGAGTVDNVNFLIFLRGQGNYTVVKPCYKNQMKGGKGTTGLHRRRGTQATFGPGAGTDL